MAYPQLGPVTGTLLSDPDILLDFVSQLCNLPIEILCLAAEGGSAQYRHVKIPKRRGGKRPVSIAEGVLHTVQATIAKAFINSLPVHPAAHGYVTGRDPLSYAAAHRSAMTPDGYLLRLDVEDFFGHLTPNRFKISEGRSILLTPRQGGDALPSFAYTYAEADGIPLIYASNYENTVRFAVTRVETS